MDLNELPEKTIGVIALGVDDFIRWKEEQNHQVVLGKGKDNIRKYVYNNTTYVRLRTVEDCRGFRFDEFYETDRAKENHRYDRIKEYISRYYLKD